MSTPLATSRRLTARPSGGVCGLTMRFDSMKLAAVRASSTVLHTFTKPALPRPPACTWAFTTAMLPPAANTVSAAFTASSMVVATPPDGTGTPASASN